jgi:ABC-2 type transport system permease protein
MYFLAPVRLRDVFLAKNLMNMSLAAVEIVAVIALLLYLRGRQPLETVILCLLWAVGALLVGMTIGNVRSITAPKRVDFTRAATKQAAPLNAFLSMGVLLAFAALGWALIFAGEMLHVRWMLVPAFAVVAGLGLVVCVLGLRKVEQIAMDNRESLYGVLSKQA